MLLGFWQDIFKEDFAMGACGIISMWYNINIEEVFIMFAEVIEKIKKKRNYEKEIIELKAKLKVAEAEKAELRKQKDVLEKSAKSITDSNVVLKQNYEVQKILENFKKELGKLPPLTGRTVQEKYNLLAIVIDSFCVPIMKELGMNDLSDKMKVISKLVKQDGVLRLCAISMHKRFDGSLTDNLSEFIEDKSKYLVNCDEEKQHVLELLRNDIQNVEFCKRFYDFVENKYGSLENVRNGQPRNPEDAKHWLEMIITLGAAAYNLIDSICFGLPLGVLSKNEKKEFNPHNIMESTSAENNVYELLYCVSAQFGLDFSKMTVCLDSRRNICNTYKGAMPPLGKERD